MKLTVVCHFTGNISFKVIFNLKYINVGILDIASRWPAAIVAIPRVPQHFRRKSKFGILL